jgi:pimeloyl-ACP methyl ester carboxylesterase
MARVEAGVPRLASSIAGLRAVRVGIVPTTNIVAHSYGTTTAVVALSKTGASVDRFVALGSAGVQNAEETSGYFGPTRELRPSCVVVLFRQTDDVGLAISGHEDEVTPSASG